MLTDISRWSLTERQVRAMFARHPEVKMFGHNKHGGHGHHHEGPFGRHGGGWFGEMFRQGNPRARRGDIRAGILALLKEGPRNGYQLMQELNDRSGGMWRP